MDVRFPNPLKQGYTIFLRKVRFSDGLSKQEAQDDYVTTDNARRMCVEDLIQKGWRGMHADHDMHNISGRAADSQQTRDVNPMLS